MSGGIDASNDKLYCLICPDLSLRNEEARGFAIHHLNNTINAREYGPKETPLQSISSSHLQSEALTVHVTPTLVSLRH